MSEAQLFTVRVWRQQAQFRAALRAVGDERTELFTEPAAVADFLCQASEPLLATTAAIPTPTAPATSGTACTEEPQS